MAGLIGVASTTLGGGIVGPVWLFPPTASRSAHIASFVVSHRTELLLGMFLNTAGVTLWLVFDAGVWSHLRGRSGADGLALACFTFGMVVMVALLLAGLVAMFVLTYRAGPTALARTLYDLTFGLLAMSGAPTAVPLVAYAALNSRTGGLPRGTRRLAVVAAVAHVVLLGSFVLRSGFLSLEGQVITAIPATLFAWIAARSIAMSRRSAHAI